MLKISLFEKYGNVLSGKVIKIGICGHVEERSEVT